MQDRCLAAARAAAVLALVSFASGPAAGQTPSSTLRTPWGHPDLQGVWNNNTSTPLERPDELAGKQVWTDEEQAEFTERQQAARENRDSREGAGTDADVGRAYNAFWFPVPGAAINRTSLISDPADGRVPALTPEGSARAEAFAAMRRGRPSGPENRSLWERCITRGLPRLPGGYNNHFQIVQSPEYVAIVIEMIHEARIIPLDGRPHLSGGTQQWLGDSRGRWDGTTLVVETTNFSDRTNFRGSGAGLHLTERFTRVDADTIAYEFTVSDPTTWSRPWTAAFPLMSLQSAVGGRDEVSLPLIFEYACHEGNYGLVGQLGGARAEDREDAARAGSK